MNIIEDIRARMELRYPHAAIEYDHTSITYYPASPQGFTMRLAVRNPGPREYYLVYYDQSCQERSDYGGSVLNFGYGLSNGWRLRVFSRDGRDFLWVTDSLGFAEWKPYWETRAFCGAGWKLWRPAIMRVLQNELIDLSGPPGGGAGAVKG